MLYLLDYLANHKVYIEEVAQLKFNQWLHTAPERPWETWLSEIKESAQIDQPPITLVALAGTDSGDRDLAGFATLVDMGDKAGVESKLWMITLYVKKQWREQGIGTHLMKRCLQECKRLKRKALYLWTESKALTNYYSKQGWKLLGSDEGTGEDVMVYRIRK
ncbi:MAG: GNAT family N-acetyltransferase [Anaerolineae bacterium]|nr:GNAT family N-acetyltransferase [Anaerolineae bacterium]